MTYKDGIIVRSRIKKVEKLENFDDEYVYDIGMKEKSQQWFFANNLLIHNTDSSYFSAYEILKDNPDYKDFEWNKDNVINLYNEIADLTNKQFSEYLLKEFNIPKSRCVIKAGRELVATKALFIKKKRYAILYYDKDNVRYDHSKEGKLKAMGLDLKRSDTPTKVQKFLEELLYMVLTDKDSEYCLEKITEFREQMKLWPSWEKGSPKKVNSLTDYTNRLKQSLDADEFMRLNKLLASANSQKEVIRLKQEIEKLKKVNLPGHVRAAINYNKLRTLNADYVSMPITDGAKIIVCKLKNNPLNMTSIAYPIDIDHLPDWFKELPFDDEDMENTIYDMKLRNLIGVLKWDIEKTKKDSTFDDLFSM